MVSETYQLRQFTSAEVEQAVEYLRTQHRELWITLLDRDVMNQSIEDISYDLWSALAKAPPINLSREVSELVGAIRSRNFTLYFLGDGIEKLQSSTESLNENKNDT